MPRPRAVRDRRSGQAMIFIVMAVIILALVALWNFDLHKTLYMKLLSQNAGDAAALAAARWQGISLNLIGDLNILKAAALTDGDTAAVQAIGDLQARLCYAGPIAAMMAAQQAAKNNGVFVNAAFTDRLRSHAAAVRNDYPAAVGPGGTMLFPEPYPGCWQEYSEMLFMLADNGIAAGPDNARLYTDYAGPHTLLDIDFYNAVAGRDWCWFFFHDLQLLITYVDFQSWPPLPARISQTNPINSEFFGLGLIKVALSNSPPAPAEMEALRQQRGLGGSAITGTLAGVAAEWYCYDPAIWTSWTAFSPTNDPPFPAAGLIRPQYDYAGADSAVRVIARARRLTPRAPPAAVTWTAAAKPFGYLSGGSARPDACGVVLPAYHNVRLIPMDASSAPAGGAYDLDWRDHIENHLQTYVLHGPGRLDPACWYCRQLMTWEDPAFRHTGIAWLDAYSDTCHVHGGPGGGPGGGTHRGH